MNSKLKNIAIIRSGIFARTVSEGDIVLLQTKHFDENGQLTSSLHPDVMICDSVERHLLKPGDVLFSAKGTRNFASVYLDYGYPCVASTSFLVIRIIKQILIPEFLAWFINHPDTLHLIKSQAIGSSIVSISKPVLEELEISVPDLKTQKAVLKISRLWEHKNLLEKQLGELRNKQLQNLIKIAIQ